MWFVKLGLGWMNLEIWSRGLGPRISRRFLAGRGALGANGGFLRNNGAEAQVQMGELLRRFDIRFLDIVGFNHLLVLVFNGQRYGGVCEHDFLLQAFD
jgi:hypothetical protein